MVDSHPRRVQAHYVGKDRTQLLRAQKFRNWPDRARRGTTPETRNEGAAVKGALFRGYALSSVPCVCRGSACFSSGSAKIPSFRFVFSNHTHFALSSVAAMPYFPMPSIVISGPPLLNLTTSPTLNS